jgi:hypothetical protein
MGIASGAKSTRVVAMSGPSETFLKAQLDPCYGAYQLM